MAALARMMALVEEPGLSATGHGGDPGATLADEGGGPPGHERLAGLGRGGMGIVYKARQTALNRVVVLKVVRAAQHASAGKLARLRVEAEVIAKLSHPNIVQIHQVGELGRPTSARRPSAPTDASSPCRQAIRGCPPCGTSAPASLFLMPGLLHVSRHRAAGGGKRAESVLRAFSMPDGKPLATFKRGAEGRIEGFAMSGDALAVLSSGPKLSGTVVLDGRDGRAVITAKRDGKTLRPARPTQGERRSVSSPVGTRWEDMGLIEPDTSFSSASLPAG